MSKFSHIGASLSVIEKLMKSGNPIDGIVEADADWLGSGLTTSYALPEELDVGLRRLAQLTGRDASWWLNRLLFNALKGRALLDQIEPLTYKLVAGNISGQLLFSESVQLSGYLANLIKGLSAEVAVSESEYVLALVTRSLYGVLGQDAERLLSSLKGAEEAVLKIWLPESVHSASQKLALSWNMSTSDVLRNILLEHLVGRLGFLNAVVDRCWLQKRRDYVSLEKNEVMFSKRISHDGKPTRRILSISKFGKSTVNKKLWCPLPVREELTRISKEQGLTASDYARGTIAAYIFGKNFQLDCTKK
jgi:predicted DNA-binding protein